MHIGFYSPGWPADEFPNGIVTYVHNLRSELMKRGHLVSVFTGRVGHANQDARIFCVERTVRTRVGLRLNRLLRREYRNFAHWGHSLAAKLNAVHRTEPIDVLEMEESFGWCADVQKSVPFPVVVKLHGPAHLTLIDEDCRTDFGRARIEAERTGLRQMATIVSPSESTLADMVSHYGLNPRIRRVVRNPIVADPGLKLWSLGKCDRKAIFFASRFDKLKGGDIVLAAFRKLLDIDPNLKLIFAGHDGGLATPGGAPIFFNAFRDSLFSEAQRERIEYLGQVPRSRLPGLRNSAMVTLVVSRWENQPNTALEAMIQGCPVVASDVGGVREIIEHGKSGLLARAGDAGDLCQQVMNVLSDPGGAQRMGECARRFVIEHHSAGKLAEEAVDVYRQAILLVKQGRAD